MSNITAREALENLRQWTEIHIRDSVLRRELDRRIAALPPETPPVPERDEARGVICSEIKFALDDCDKETGNEHYHRRLLRHCARLLLHGEARRG